MVAALALLAVLASSAVADPLARTGVAVVDEKGPLGFDVNALLAALLAPFDPYNVPPLPPFDLDLKEISAKGSVSNAVVTGVSGLRLLSLKLSELGNGKAAVSLHVPAVSVEGDYVVTGAVKEPIKVPLDSAGKFTFGFTDLDVQASIQLGISNEGRILLKDFQLPYWNLTNIELNLGGLFNGSPLGKMINEVLHDMLPHLITKAYHDKLTTQITSAVIKEGGKYLADLHHDHARPAPALRGGGLRRAHPEAPVVAAPVPDSVPALSSHSVASDKQTDLLPAASLDSEQLLGIRGLFAFNLLAPRFYPHGSLASADSGAPAAAAQGKLAQSPPAPSLSDIREAAVDKVFDWRLAPAQFYRHGELSSGSESSEVNSGVAGTGLLGLLSGHGVKLQPVGEALFYEKGQLSADLDDGGAHWLADSE